MANGVWTVVERVDDGTSEKANEGRISNVPGKKSSFR